MGITHVGDHEGLVAGKVAIVTGGGAGIGEAICKVFARHGARVVVNGLPGDPIEDVAREIRQIGGIAVAHTGDVGTQLGAEDVVQIALDEYGRIDVLIANAGLFPEQMELQDFPVERFEELLHSNIRGTYLPIRAALPHLQQSKGCVLVAASEAGIHGLADSVCYSASKAWAIGFAKALAGEQGRHGVRCNAVAPGPIDTEMTRPTKGAITRKHAAMAVRTVPMGRRGTPEEVANVYLFLASGLASFVNGAVVSVDGGATATSGIPGAEADRDVREAPEGTVELEHQYEGRGTLGG